MDFSEALLRVVHILKESDTPYMIVGSMASMLYGEPRMTHDVDLVVDLAPAAAKQMEQLFAEEEFYCPPLEILQSEIVHRGQFNLIHHQSGLKIDLVIRKNTDHARLEFARRRKLVLWGNVEAYFASPEDVIIKKLEYFREGGSEKHVKDIRGILAETKVDAAYLQEWVAKLRLDDAWAACA